MNLISATDIKKWTGTASAQTHFSTLINKLVKASLDPKKIELIRFLGPDQMNLSGWDGTLKTSDSCPFVPDGTSLWEFGTGQNPLTKASDDYKNRSKEPLGFVQHESTFIFATPHVLDSAKKDAWIREKSDEKIWKDVRIIDGIDLESWVEDCPAVCSWLATMLRIAQSGNFESGEVYWKKWTSHDRYKFSSKLVTAGRDNNVAELLQWLDSPPAKIAVQSTAKEESLAFILTVMASAEQAKSEELFSRCIIIRSSEEFDAICNTKNSLYLIPQFEDSTSFRMAVDKGHHVLVPINQTNTLHDDRIELPRLNIDILKNGLMETGLQDDEVDRMITNGGKDLLIVRRLLGYNNNQPAWALSSNARELVPAMLIGQWDENKEGDQEAVAKISGMKYEDFISIMQKWVNEDQSPLRKIGHQWQIISRLDCWNRLSKYIGNADLVRFESTALEVLKEKNPALDLPKDERYMAQMRGKIRIYSNDLRKGIADTLILLATQSDLQDRVNNILFHLLEEQTTLSWISFNDMLQQFAEASPDTFLQSCNRLLKNRDEARQFFVESASIVFSNSYHTHLLWALEMLSWFPQYLAMSAECLSQLAEVDPGGQLMNRPIRSLRNLFIPVFAQTMTSYEDREKVLRKIVVNHPTVAFDLLLGLLPRERERHVFISPQLQSCLPRHTMLSLDLSMFPAQTSRLLVPALRGSYSNPTIAP